MTLTGSSHSAHGTDGRAWTDGAQAKRSGMRCTHAGSSARTSDRTIRRFASRCDRSVRTHLSGETPFGFADVHAVRAEQVLAVDLPFRLLGQLQVAVAVDEIVGSRTPRTPSGPAAGARSGSHSHTPAASVCDGDEAAARASTARRRDPGRAEPTRPRVGDRTVAMATPVTPMPPADLRTFLMRGRTRLMLVVLVCGLTVAAVPACGGGPKPGLQPGRPRPSAHRR
jgi:hypothetical protein